MKFALLVAALSCLLMVSSSWNDAPSYDEPEHATAGYCYVRTGWFWMNPFHPPLVKELAGLGLCLVPNTPPWDDWQRCRKMPAIDAFFCGLGNDPQQLIRAARLPIILACCAFLPVFFALVRRQLDERAAFLSLLMLAFSPTWLAHSRLVNTDALAAAGAFVCVAMLVEHLKNPSRRTLLALGLATGVAQLIKFSLAVLPPFYLLVYLVSRRNPLKDGLAVAVLTLTVVWAGYALTPPPPAYQSWYNSIIFKREDPLVHALRSTGGPLAWWVTGLYAQTQHLLYGHDRPSYLRQHYYQGGRWDFFPTLLVTKEPCGYLVLTLLALIKGRRNRTVGLYLGFVAAYLAVALGGNLNMGIRHALPVFPCLFAAIGWGLASVDRRLIAAALVWAWVSILTAWPGYLAYFNELAGGKRHGPLTALDSNFDWGVDLYRLKLRDQKVTTLYYGRLPARCYLGEKAVPYGGPFALKKGDVLAISANYWVQLQLHMAGKAPPPLELSSDVARWLGSMEVTETVGDTIFLVRVK